MEEKREKKLRTAICSPLFFFFFSLTAASPASVWPFLPTSANLKTSANLAAGQGFKSKHYPPAIFQRCLSYPDPPPSFFFFTPLPRRPPFAIAEMPVSAAGWFLSVPGVPLRCGKPAGRAPSGAGRACPRLSRGTGSAGTAAHHPLPAQCTRLSQRCGSRLSRFLI